MTDDEKLQMWQLGAVFNNIPDYPNDDTAAMSLLDTLVEKGYDPELYHGSSDGIVSEWYFQTHPQASWYHVRPTRRAAVVAAVLELIWNEASHYV